MLIIWSTKCHRFHYYFNLVGSFFGRPSLVHIVSPQRKWNFWFVAKIINVPAITRKGTSAVYDGEIITWWLSQVDLWPATARKYGNYTKWCFHPMVLACRFYACPSDNPNQLSCMILLEDFATHKTFHTVFCLNFFFFLFVCFHSLHFCQLV